MKKLIEWILNSFQRTFFLLCFLSLGINITVEILSRRSFAKAFRFMIRNPYMFLMGCLIILFTLCLSFFVRKRAFALTIASSFWLISGIVNFNVVGYRTTPVSVMDIIKIPSVITIAPVYYAVWQLILMGLAIIAFLFVMELFRRRCHKYPVKIFLKNTFIALLSIALVFTVMAITGINYGITEKSRGKVVDHYDNNGFVYSFSKSAFYWGVEQPEDYSFSTAGDILKFLNKTEFDDEEIHPNLIFVQLESFFDVNRLKSITLSKDPIPEFHKLQKAGFHGLLHVPVVGAGTINTEFEVLTGMSMEYFGLGELPFATVLEDRTTETIAYNLGEKGYTNHFIHNNEGDFYSRDLVYSHLGFDTFTSVEFMNNVEYNICGTWPKDTILTQYIMDAMYSTSGPDLLMTVTVQSHGKYPPNEIPVDYIPEIEASFNDATVEEGISSIDAVRYYVNEIHEVDRFIGELYEKINKFPEKTIMVLYGDHLPSLSISQADLNEGTDMDTEYVIVSNFGLEKKASRESYQKENHDLYSYQLYSEVLSYCGIHDGAMTKLHQTVRDMPQYKQWLNVLEYTMLGNEPDEEGNLQNTDLEQDRWEIKPLKFGIKPFQVISVNFMNNKLIINGNGFTPYSKIMVDNRIYNETEFINERVIQLETDVKTISKGHKLNVCQISNRGTVYRQTDDVQWSD